MATRLTLFIPGTPSSTAAWIAALAARGLDFDGQRLRGAFEAELEFVANDGRFATAFALPTVTDEERRRIGSAPGALVMNVDRSLQEVAKELAAVVALFEKCGALAVRIEQSKLGFPVARWVELVGSGDPRALYRAAVLVLVDRETDTQHSCGMHVFSLPDAAAKLDGVDQNSLLGSFNVFQLVDDPVLRTGETFAPDASAPKRVLRRIPDPSYPASHACHNPFGRWELGPEGGRAEPLGESALVFMPPLVAVIASAERQHGTPLTRPQVEKLVEKAACITMAPRDAVRLERARGYADIDPERAFEQWQAIRPS